MKSILSKLWLGITALVLIMLLIIWLFQIGLLNEFYIRERQQVLMEEAEKLRTIMLESREFNTVTYEMVEEVHRFTSSINAFVQIINVQNQSLFMNTPGRYFINDRESDRFERKGPPHLWEDKAIVPYITKGEPFAIHRIRTRAPEASIVVGVPVYDGEELVANIVITSALAPIEEAITILKKQLSIISILSLGIGTLLALFLAKFFVKPIVKIIEAAESISKGDFSVKIIHQSNDEIGILGETINDMAVQLDKIERLRKEFIANVSHELKTPITLIKAYAEVVKDMDLGEQDKQQHLQVIIEESDRLNDMVEDILYLSKMESGFSDLQYGEVNLDEVIECIVEKLSYFASQKNIQIVMEIETEMPIVYGDENKLYQVFYNVINNAIHHSYENSKIFLQVFDMEAGIRIEIIDEGSGIPEEDLPYIWDRFYKVDKSRKRDESGTGLGMAIVKNILEAHGFQYGIKSKMNQGTTVWIEI